MGGFRGLVPSKHTNRKISPLKNNISKILTFNSNIVATQIKKNFGKNIWCVCTSDSITKVHSIIKCKVGISQPV